MEHLLNLSLEIGFEISREDGLAPQETAQARRGLGLERYKPHEWLAGAGDHHLLSSQGLVDIAGKVGLGVVEVDLHNRAATTLIQCSS
jgi:hypothetical protein